MNRLTHIAVSSVLTLFAATLAAQPRQAPRTIYDITALLAQYQPDAGRQAALQAVVAQNPDSGTRMWDNYLARSRAFTQLGSPAEAVFAARRAAELAPGAPKDISFMIELSNAERLAGNFANSIRVLEQIVATYPPSQHAGSLSNLVHTYMAVGDLESARATFRRNETAFAGLANKSPAPTALFESARARLLQSEGKLAAAEQVERKAVAEADRDVETMEARTKAGQAGASPEGAFERRDALELWLADMVREQGRLSEAELIVRGVLLRVVKRFGRFSTLASRAAQTLAQSVFDQGRFAEAAALTRQLIDGNNALGLPPASYWTIQPRQLLAAALATQSKWQEAAAEHERIKAAFASAPEATARLQSANSYIVVALLKTGNIEEALAQSRRLLNDSEQRLGREHFETAEARGIHAMALAARGEREQALKAFAAAVPLLVDNSAAQATEDGLAPSRTKRLEWILGDYVRLLADPQGGAEARRMGVDPFATSFQLADALRGHSVQRALASATSRAAANDPALATLVRQEQDLRHEVTALYRYLSNMLSAPPDQQLPKVTADMRARIQAIGSQRKALLATLDQRFPAYSGLVNPRPATVEQARAAMRRGEALLSILTTPERTFVWALPWQGPGVFASIGLGEDDIAAVVRRLRRALDPGPLALERYPDFDLAGAYQLYAALLKPVEEGWGGASTLLVASNGPVSQIPLALLPTAASDLLRDKAVLFDRYRNVPWLARRLAVAQVPAVSSLVTLRALPVSNTQRLIFLGFGDPQFARGAAAPMSAGMAVQRNLRIPRGASRSADATPLEWIRYEDIPPLPDTRDEILAIAKALGADPRKDVFLGADASKQRLMSMDLSNRRILAFATHGLIPGDFPNLDQPALALATPAGIGETGLLTLEEILGLKLDADWVVLSACNTAAGDGQGAEAVSGLGRGFFYAGSKALLVTHWPVESVSARKLVTGIFERYAQDAQLTRAEALRQSMLALMQGESGEAPGRQNYSYAHPMFWAPYALVGDGAR